MNHDETETLSDAPEEDAPTPPQAFAAQPPAPANDAPEATEAEAPAPAAEDVTSPEVAEPAATEAESPAPADEGADEATEDRAEDVTSPEAAEPETTEAESPAPADEGADEATEERAEDVTSPEVTAEEAPGNQAGAGASTSEATTTTSEEDAADGGNPADESAEVVSSEAASDEAEEESSADVEARSPEVAEVAEPAEPAEPADARAPEASHQRPREDRYDPHADIVEAEDPEAAARAALGLDGKVEEVELKPEEAKSILAAVTPAEEEPEEEEGEIEDIVLEPDLGGADLVEVFDEDLVSREPSPYDRAGHWYVVHTYSGYEKKVKSNLESRVKSLHMEGKIHEVVIPMDDVIEFKGGKKTVVQKKVFPGYLLVRMDLEDDTWQAVRNTPGVTAFVGGGAKPTPLSRKEVESILRVRPEEETRKARPRLDYEVGDQVRVTAGPFADFNGMIDEINVDQSTLKVLVNIFGRETPVTLDFADVAKL